jgi:hypothetical protein
MILVREHNTVRWSTSLLHLTRRVPALFFSLYVKNLT